VYVTVAEEYYTAKGKEEMARNLLARGISPDVIAESAGLPLDKIQDLMK
jgi:hypothetical protein